MVKFATYTREEQAAADRIVDRAFRLKIWARRMDVAMDLSAVHATRPLRLAELANADDFNFAHDMVGIARHLDRETGELGGCFVPRFARREVRS